MESNLAITMKECSKEPGTKLSDGLLFGCAYGPTCRAM